MAADYQSDTSPLSGWLRWGLRSLCLVALAGIALVTSGWDPWGGDAQQPQNRAATSDGSGGQSLGEPGAWEGPAEDAAPGGAAELQDPMVQRLGRALIDGNPVYEQLDESTRLQLQQTIERADAILSETRRDNRRALREANRQPRLRRGRTPNLVVILTTGISPERLRNPRKPLPDLEVAFRDEDSEDSEDSAKPPAVGERGSAEHRAEESGPAPDQQLTPIDRLAAQGIVCPNVRLAAGDLNANLRVLFQGGRRRVRNGGLAEVCWNSGYTTAIIGDFGWTGVSADDTQGFDQWFGTAGPLAPYPTEVSANGQPLVIRGNAGGATRIHRTALLESELQSYLQRHRTGRPFLLVLSLNSFGHDECQVMLQQVRAKLAENALESHSLLVLLTFPPLVSTPNSPRSAARGSLVASWPGRLAMGKQHRAAVGLEDLLPTLSASIDSWRSPGNLPGKSFWQALLKLASDT